MDDTKEVEKKTKTKKTKKTKLSTANTFDNAIDEIKTNEKQILKTTKNIQYDDIDKQKNTVAQTVKKIEDAEKIINKKEQELMTTETTKQVITENEFNERMAFIKKYQDVESFDTEELINIYNKLNQYVEDCKTFIDSTSINIEHC